MSSEDLKKIFDESIGSTKAYFINKVQQKFPRLDKKDIEAWFKSQEVVQINATVKGVNLKITSFCVWVSNQVDTVVLITP